jgi:hypothetical protein
MSMELRRALDEVARRIRRVRLWGALAVCWVSWALIGWVLSALLPAFGERAVPGGWVLVSFAAAALTTGLVCTVVALRSARDPRVVARRIEATHPDLGTGLLAAVEQSENGPGGRLGFLQNAVIRQALEHRLAHDWDEVVPTWTLRGFEVVHAIALIALLVVGLSLFSTASSEAGGTISFSFDPARKGEIQVEPGNTEIERGTSLLVVARFNGMVPAEARLVLESETEATASRPMTRSLEDPTFAARVETVLHDLSYRVEYGGRQSETYRVHVFEYPELRRADAALEFPAYTGLERKTIEDVRHVTAVEGTKLTLTCRLNKEVATARLVDDKDQPIALAPIKGQEADHLYQASITLTEPRRLRAQLVDAEGRANKLPAEITLNVTRNRPATVKMTRPARDVDVSPIEELPLKAESTDDFGIVRHGVSYTIGGEPPREVVLPEPNAQAKQVASDYLLDFESLKAEPDQLVSFFFWAEDIGPDGKPRRASGDMFFAEVRRFEEIFRQGEQGARGGRQNGAGQGQGQQSEQLAQLQKEIINGTWKMIRRELGAKPSPKFTDDAKVLLESQQSAIQQAAQVGERLQDPTAANFLEQAVRHMKEAETQLTTAAETTSIPALTPALTAEQAAYQALLKLRAHEFQVTRGNRQQGGGGGGGGGRMQRQLNQLELSADENRYEEQKTAQSQQDSQREREQRENRQVLSRLRELSQRQNDLNERLKELQSALEAAKTPQAREEIERQLKRLREQQQQMLRDTDELRERMENDENRERMADSRQQLEQTREHLRQASEALEQGRVPQAVTAGARAGKELNDLREDVRKSTSNRFTDDLNTMREQARQLDQNQGQLTEQLGEWDKNPQRSLRDTGERAQVREKLAQQDQKLEKLLEQMRNTVQNAEETEPLLAKNLYDAVRKANEQKIPDALKVAQQLVDAGVPDDAAKVSQQAGEGLQQLRDGVDRAARGILGDETAALKRAQGELDDLEKQLNREINEATGRQAGDDAQRPGQPNTRPGRNGQGDPKNQVAQRGEGQPRDAQANGAEPGTRKGQQRQPGAGRDPEPQDQNGERGQPREPREDRGEQDARGAQRDPNGEGREPGQPGDPQGQQGGQQDRQGQPGDPQGQQGGQQGAQGEQRDQQGQQGGQQNGQGQPRDQQGQQPGGRNRRGGQRQAGGPQPGGALDRVIDGFNGGPAGPGNPITGEGFRQWVDRMREVEELLENPEMRAEAARIRDRARGAREEFKRHAKMPDWNQLKTLVADPIHELRDRISEEVRRRESPDSLTPIDRDPVPPQYAEAVRRYYERLGSGR